MKSPDVTEICSNIDRRWPYQVLLDIIGFQNRVRGRVEWYLEERGLKELSWKEFMDLFLPPATEPISDFPWRLAPIQRQRQFGPYLHDSALLTLTEADISPAFRAEWLSRIYNLKPYELRRRPTNIRLHSIR